MAIQIFGSSKSFDTKKALRWFAERRIPVQEVSLKDKGISAGELESVISCLSPPLRLIPVWRRRGCYIKTLCTAYKGIFIIHSYLRYFQ